MGIVNNFSQYLHAVAVALTSSGRYYLLDMSAAIKVVWAEELIS
jgi:hypothetical protein